MKAAESNVVPAGIYNVQCEECVMKTNERTGKKSISMKFKIIGPTNKGRVVFQNYYCFSDNESHNKKQFDTIGVFAKRAGIEEDKVASLDLGDFVGLSAGAGIKVTKSEGYSDKNEISYFRKPIDEISEAAAAQATATSGSEATEKAPF